MTVREESPERNRHTTTLLSLSQRVITEDIEAVVHRPQDRVIAEARDLQYHSSRCVLIVIGVSSESAG